MSYNDGLSCLAYKQTLNPFSHCLWQNNKIFITKEFKFHFEKSYEGNTTM